MQRPLFSSSYSAKLIEQRNYGAGYHDGSDWREQTRLDARTKYWVQKGVTTRGEIWGVYSDIESETVVDEYDGLEREFDDDERVGDGEDLGPHYTEKPERASSHGYGRHMTGSNTAQATGKAAFSPSLSTTTTLTMAAKTYWWISLWFAVTIPVIFWDAFYCFLRPRSMVGGDLHWIWSPYALYQDIDYVYGLRAYENGEGFTNAQSALNIVENFFNIAYLYLAHVSGSPIATLVGFTSAVMTLSKTVLYWAQEYYCGGCSVGHNDFNTLLVYWIIPNGLWLVVPSFIIARLWSDIASSLRATTSSQSKIKKQ